MDVKQLHSIESAQSALDGLHKQFSKNPLCTREDTLKALHILFNLINCTSRLVKLVHLSDLATDSAKTEALSPGSRILKDVFHCEKFEAWKSTLTAAKNESSVAGAHASAVAQLTSFADAFSEFIRKPTTRLPTWMDAWKNTWKDIGILIKTPVTTQQASQNPDFITHVPPLPPPSESSVRPIPIPANDTTQAPRSAPVWAPTPLSWGQRLRRWAKR